MIIEKASLLKTVYIQIFAILIFIKYNTTKVSHTQEGKQIGRKLGGKYMRIDR